MIEFTPSDLIPENELWLVKRDSRCPRRESWPGKKYVIDVDPLWMECRAREMHVIRLQEEWYERERLKRAALRPDDV